MDAQETQTPQTREERMETAHRCFCTEAAIDRVAQRLIDEGIVSDTHAAQTQATFLVIGEEEGCTCRKN